MDIVRNLLNVDLLNGQLFLDVKGFQMLRSYEVVFQVTYQNRDYLKNEQFSKGFQILGEAFVVSEEKNKICEEKTLLVSHMILASNLYYCLFLAKKVDKSQIYCLKTS